MTQAPITQPDRAPRPCLELGVCQNRKPLCDDCLNRPLQSVRHYFAPGVIEHSSKKRQVHALLRWTLRCVGLMAVVAVVAFGLGYQS